MNMTLANGGYNFTFTSDRGPWAVWRMAAKDGFELQPWQQRRARSGSGGIVSRRRIEVVAARDLQSMYLGS